MITETARVPVVYRRLMKTLVRGSIGDGRPSALYPSSALWSPNHTSLALYQGLRSLQQTTRSTAPAADALIGDESLPSPFIRPSSVCPSIYSAK